MTDVSHFDFDPVIDRHGTNAIATDGFRRFLFDDQPIELPGPDEDAMSMWVADMAFPVAPAATAAMRERIDHPIFGYTVNIDDRLFDAFSGWCRRRYGWAPDRDHFVTASGVVPTLFELVDLVLEPGEAAVTLTPAYAFFEHAAVHHDRTLVTCALTRDGNGGVSVDFDALEQALTDPAVRMFFLCHPHNPTGRVWAEDELRRMTELCAAHDVLVVSDEVHCDLLRTGERHTPLAALFPDSDRIVTCMSASKTFNLAGLGLAHVIIPDDVLRERWKERVFPIVNPLSLAAVTAVFDEGDDWLAALRLYLDDNLELVARTLAERLPDAGFRIPAATYLAWIDLGAYFTAGSDLTRHFAESVGLLLEGDDKFVADADGHVRLNVACPRSMVAEGLDRLVTATVGADTVSARPRRG